MGWIQLHDKIRNSTFYKKPEYYLLWCELMMSANHAPQKKLHKNQTFVIGRGQLLTSRKKLSEDTGIPESNVKYILNYFEDEKQITRENMHTGTCISIVNYDQYQTSVDFDQRIDQRTTNEEKPINIENYQRTTNELPTDNDENYQRTANEKDVVSDCLSNGSVKLNGLENVETYQRTTNEENHTNGKIYQRTTNELPTNSDDIDQPIDQRELEDKSTFDDLQERVLDVSKSNFFLTKKSVTIDMSPRDFLTQHMERHLQDMNKNSGLGIEEFDFFFTQWSLTSIERGWEFSNDSAADAKRLIAGLQKWINSCAKGEKKWKGEHNKIPIKVDKQIMLLSDFAAIGHTFEELTDTVKVAMDKFLKYKFERKEPILQGQIIESLLIKMWGVSRKDEDLIYMINNTMACNAKNIIADLKDKDRGKESGGYQQKNNGLKKAYEPKENDYAEASRKNREQMAADKLKQPSSKNTNEPF